MMVSLLSTMSRMRWKHHAQLFRSERTSRKMCEVGHSVGHTAPVQCRKLRRSKSRSAKESLRKKLSNKRIALLLRSARKKLARKLSSANRNSV